MKKFIAILGNGLESSSCKTEECKTAQKVFKKEFGELLKKKGCSNLEVSNGHFYVSGFFTSPTGQMWYFSCQDFRDPPENLMYRTAKSYKDYTGGSNNWASLENLERELRVEYLKSQTIETIQA